MRTFISQLFCLLGGRFGANRVVTQFDEQEIRYSKLHGMRKLSYCCWLVLTMILVLGLNKSVHATNIEVTARKYLNTVLAGNVPSATCANTAPSLSMITPLNTADFYDKK